MRCVFFCLLFFVTSFLFSGEDVPSKQEDVHLLKLPDELLVKIFSYLEPADCLALNQVCKHTNGVVSMGLSSGEYQKLSIYEDGKEENLTAQFKGETSKDKTHYALCPTAKKVPPFLRLLPNFQRLHTLKLCFFSPDKGATNDRLLARLTQLPALRSLHQDLETINSPNLPACWKLASYAPLTQLKSLCLNLNKDPFPKQPVHNASPEDLKAFGHLEELCLCAAGGVYSAYRSPAPQSISDSPHDREAFNHLSNLQKLVLSNTDAPSDCLNRFTQLQFLGGLFLQLPLGQEQPPFAHNTQLKYLHLYNLSRSLVGSAGAMPLHLKELNLRQAGIDNYDPKDLNDRPMLRSILELSQLETLNVSGTVFRHRRDEFFILDTLYRALGGRLPYLEKGTQRLCALKCLDMEHGHHHSQTLQHICHLVSRQEGLGPRESSLEKLYLSAKVYLHEYENDMHLFSQALGRMGQHFPHLRKLSIKVFVYNLEASYLCRTERHTWRRTPPEVLFNQTLWHIKEEEEPTFFQINFAEFI